MTQTLHSPWINKLTALGDTGLSTAGRTLTECFMLAQWHGRGTDNREVLSRRLRMATPEQRNAALSLFDEFCKAKGI